MPEALKTWMFSHALELIGEKVIHLEMDTVVRDKAPPFYKCPPLLNSLKTLTLKIVPIKSSTRI
jgi:hypothetical protein